MDLYSADKAGADFYICKQDTISNEGMGTKRGISSYNYMNMQKMKWIVFADSLTGR